MFKILQFMKVLLNLYDSQTTLVPRLMYLRKKTPNILFMPNFSIFLENSLQVKSGVLLSLGNNCDLLFAILKIK